MRMVIYMFIYTFIRFYRTHYNHLHENLLRTAFFAKNTLRSAAGAGLRRARQRLRDCVAKKMFAKMLAKVSVMNYELIHTQVYI